MTEMPAIWGSIFAYVVSTILFIIGVFLSKERLVRFGVSAAGVGWLIQTVAIGVRWARVGHAPLLGFFEVALLLSYLAVAGFLILQWRYPGLRIAGIAVMPLSFLILGSTLLVTPEAQAITGSLASYWLLIHIAFAQLGFAFYVASFVLAVAYLLRESKHADRFRSLLDRLPAQEVLDSLMFRLVGIGFVFQGIMIASGSIWANEAWGSYWSWDPIETWSLLAWGMYAIYLHLTLTMGWRGKKAAWIVVGALAVILFSLLGVPLAYHSIHSGYLFTS